MKAISPVIATVIIVAVAIAIAVAVAFWMMGIVSSQTTVERLEVITPSAIRMEDATYGTEYYVISILVRNTGPSDATIQEVFINSQPYWQYGNVKIFWAPGRAAVASIDQINTTAATVTLQSGGTANVFDQNTGVPLASGQEVTFFIIVPRGQEPFKSGVNIFIELRSARGQSYQQSVTLP